MFVKLTSYYGPVYVRIDQIRSIRVDREGDTIIRFIRDDADVISVRETPDEVIKRIEEIVKKEGN